MEEVHESDRDELDGWPALSRREFLVRGAAVMLLPGLAAALLSACGGSGTNEAAPGSRFAGTAVLQGTLGGVAHAELSAFHEQFPRAQIVAQPYYPTLAADERALLTNDRGAYDFAFGDLALMDEIKAAGFAATLSRQTIPNLRFVDEAYRRLCPFAVPNDYSVSVIAYRKDLVGESPATWSDFWRLAVKHSGRVAIADDERATIGTTLKSLGLSANATDAPALQRVAQALVELKPHLWDRRARPGQKIVSDLDEGTVVLAQCSNHIAAAAKRANAQVASIIPSDGTCADMNCFVPLRGAAHPEIVAAFLNFHLEPSTYAQFVNARATSWVESPAAPYLASVVRASAALRPTPAQLARAEWARYLGAGQTLWDLVWQQFNDA